jgi:hypothetical protein
MTMKRAYRTLLRLYPADYRVMFAAEMMRAMDRLAEEQHGQLAAELLDLMAGAAREWVAKWTTDPSVRGRSLPDLRFMRPPDVPKELWYRSN